MTTTPGYRPPASADPMFRTAVTLLALLALLVACNREPSVDAHAPTAPGATDGPAFAAAGGEAFSPDEPTATAADDDAEDEDDEDVDYWKGVRFDEHNFSEVTDYVTTYYIDDKVDHQRAWVAAANSALGVLEHDMELLPESFLKARRGHVDEEGRLDGDTQPFLCKGKPMAGVMLHRIPGSLYLKFKAKKRPERRLTDEEILELREKAKTRYQTYRKGWEALSFGKDEFQCAMDLVKARLSEEKKARDAAKAAAEAKGEPAKAEKKDAKATKKDAKSEKKDAKAAKVAKADDRPTKQPGLYEEAPDEDKRRRFDPDIHRAWLAASSAYLYALDPHSAVIARKQWDESTRKTLDSSFEGIGAVLTQRDKRTIVENPMEGLPAWRAGVRAGDEIQKVDGVEIGGWMLHKVVERIRGKKNTTVTLTIAREGEPRPIDIAIVRAHIPIKNVTGKLVPEFPGVGHVKMSGFVPRSARDLRDAIEELAKQAPGGKLQGLILDLRRNSGGLLNRAIDVADMFLRSGRIVSVKSRRKVRGGGNEEVYSAHDDKSDYDFPVVVLVDDGSASASEIVASALQENGRALVVGLRTFGKASVQTLFEPALHLDYYIKLTVARYYGPAGHTIQVTGVHPDIEVAPKADGKIPVGFREENLTNHLEPISAPPPSPMAPMVKSLNKCVEKEGKAQAIATRTPKPQILPDYQLLKAADYLRCLARLQSGQ